MPVEIVTAGNKRLLEPVYAFVRDEMSSAITRGCFVQLGSADAHVEQGDIKTAIAALAATSSPRILIVDISGFDNPLQDIHRLADVCDPSTSVLVIGDQNDVVLYRRMKELGISEYLFKPLTLDLMVRACRTALGVGLPVAQSRTGKIVTLIGVRGGAGSTMIAANLAWHFATHLSRDVALLDLDLQSGDTALQLNVQPTQALRAALEHPDRIDDLFVSRAAIKVAPKLQLFATVDPVGEPLVPDEIAVMRLLDNLRDHHRYVFVDAPTGAGLHFDRLLSSSSTIVLVGEPTVIAAREMVRWQDKVKAVRGDATIHRVLNKAGIPGGLTLEEFGTAVGVTPDVVIPFDPEILRRTNAGEPAIDKCRGVRTALGALIRDLTGERDDEPRSLLARVFRK